MHSSQRPLPLWLGLLGALLAGPGMAAEVRGMRHIPAGEFQMGSTDEQAWAEEKPAHRVRLTRPFLMDETETTNAQFQAFVSATGYKTVAERALIRMQDPASPMPPGAGVTVPQADLTAFQPCSGPRMISISTRAISSGLR